MDEVTTTPRSDGAQLLASFTTTRFGGGVSCSGCGYPIPPDAYHECWRLIENGKRVTETTTIMPADARIKDQSHGGADNGRS